MFPVIRIRSSRAEALEDLGSKAKFWYRDDDTSMLFKAEERGTGEDWAEKVVCELAALLGLPHVQYELARDDDRDQPGVICASLAPPPLSLVHGNQLLLALDPEYPNGPERHYHCREHTVDAVFDAVRLLDPPSRAWCSDLPAVVMRAEDTFAGYLMLDAWAANQDRHHQNWGAVWNGEHFSLAPSFDHGASLARNLSDEERSERLTSHDRGRRIPHFARRARSALYAAVSAGKPLPTLEAWRAWAERVPEAAQTWQGRLAGVSEDALREILKQVPPDRMSAICRQFTLNLLIENRRRILTSEEP
ncbi:hypothetical protein [Salinisphaera sp.]|uniref:hypothetical protein n=1 Tax=Salinisphaera sp. TaxID=1914330 RepID=UPI002D769015|nr:hypothetical protein [Salinisphaera sp.]HET7314000.1 hypothetical protein [Salinisphaera sp.]